MNRRILVTVLALGAASPFLKAARADDPIALNQVPSAARRAAQTAAPGVKFTKALFDEPNRYYKLRAKDAKGRDLQVLSDAEGEFVQVIVATPTTRKDVPEAVLKTHADTISRPGRFRFKATKFVRSEQTTVGLDKKTIMYDFIGKNEDGDLVHQVIREDGTGLGLGNIRE